MSRFVYPRLSLSFAKKQLTEIESAVADSGLQGAERLAGTEHSQAAPVATGGRVADRARLTDVRNAVIEALSPWNGQESVPSMEVAAYDLALGRALHQSLEIVPADAGHVETWSFLTLVVCPDVAVRRFPAMHHERMLGTPRNALRRTWFREQVIGDIQRAAEHPLGEDELVGLFERTAVARNHSLVRTMASAVLAYRGPGRSEWARELYKHVTFATGPRMLDALSTGELDDLVLGAARAASGEAPHADVGSTSHMSAAFAPASSRGARTGSTPGQPAATALGSPAMPRVEVPLESRLRQAMLDIYQRAKSELNYDAKLLLRMLANDGAVATATRLVMSDRLSEGFIFLWTHERLDLTVEALVTHSEFQPLFEQEVVAHAERRLRGYGGGG